MSEGGQGPTTIPTTEIDEWVRLGIISADQATRIRERLPERDAKRLNLLTIAYYAGGFTVLLAYTIFMGQQWQHFSAGTQSAIAALTIGALWLIGYFIRRGASRLGGDLLIFAGAGVTPILVYSLQKYLGLGDIAGSYRDYYRLVAPSWVVMEIVGIAVGAVAVWLTRFPLHTLLIAHWAWFLSLDGARWLSRTTEWSWGDREWTIGLATGLILLSLAVTLRARATRNYSVWLYIYGFPLTFFNLAALVQADDMRRVLAALLGAILVTAGWWIGESGRDYARNAFYVVGHLIVISNLGALALQHEGLVGLAFFIVYVAVVVLSTWLGSRIFLAFGATGCYAYVSYLAFKTFADTLGFPFVLAIVGLLIVLSAAAYERVARPWLQRRITRTRTSLTASAS